jgi:hypothetical protein
MKEKILQLIEELQLSIKDIEKVENKDYGYKSAAVRARKICGKVSEDLKQLRRDIQKSKTEEK